MNDCISPFGLLKFFLNPNSAPLACQSMLDFLTPPCQLSLSHYLFLFLLTCLVEAPIYGLGSGGLKIRDRVLQIFFLNLATHPLITWLFPIIFSERPYSEYVFGSEVFAFTVEIFLLAFLYRYSWKRALLVGGLANLFSWWVGATLDVDSAKLLNLI